MELHITCIPGDGIGPEIVRETKKVLDKVAHKYGHKMIYKDILMGGACIDVHGVPLTEEAIADAKAADAVLMAVIPPLPPGTNYLPRSARKQDFWQCARR